MILYLQNFARQLDPDQEIALGFAGSNAGVLRIEGVGFFDPDLLTFYGRTEDGLRRQLVQHISQLNLRLKAAPKQSLDSTPPRRFSFELATSSHKLAPKGDGPVTAQAE